MCITTLSIVNTRLMLASMKAETCCVQTQSLNKVISQCVQTVSCRKIGQKQNCYTYLCLEQFQYSRQLHIFTTLGDEHVPEVTSSNVLSDEHGIFHVSHLTESVMTITQEQTRHHLKILHCDGQTFHTICPTDCMERKSISSRTNKFSEKQKEKNIFLF